VADDVLWNNRSRAPYAGMYKGKDGVRAFFDALGIIDIEQFDVHTLMDQDDTVVALVDSRWTVMATGRTVANPLVQVLMVRDGKVAAFDEFEHDAEAVWS